MQPGLSAGVVLIPLVPHRTNLSLSRFFFFFNFNPLLCFCTLSSITSGVTQLRTGSFHSPLHLCRPPALPLHFHPAWDNSSDSNYKSMLTLSAQISSESIKTLIKLPLVHWEEVATCRRELPILCNLRGRGREGGSLCYKKSPPKKINVCCF